MITSIQGADEEGWFRVCSNSKEEKVNHENGQNPQKE